MLDYKDIRPSQILLDPQNPRLPDGTSSDKEAINRLLDEGYNQMLALARDLVDRGEANPTELPIVMRAGSKYLVLEGNRRIAALKLLADPKLANDEDHQATFERIKNRKGARPPRSLYCVIAKDRDEADPWITLRHTGANDGVGVRVWSAEQNARHRRRMKAPIDSGTARAIAIADELTETYQVDTELVDLINKVRSSKLTNIGRFFSGVTLPRMQFVMRQLSDDGPQTLYAKHTANQLRSYFLWAFSFLDEHSVDAFKNDALRGSLLNDHADLLPDPAHSLTDYVRLADYPYTPSAAEAGPEDKASGSDSSGTTGTGSGDPSGSSAAASAGTDASGGAAAASSDAGKSAGRKRDKKEERSLYSEVKLPNLSTSVQRLLREAKQLPIEDNFAIACVLARVILELAVSDPKVLQWSGKSERDGLADKINACIIKLDPNIGRAKQSRQDLVQAHLETKEIGVTYLHQFMHNPSAKADAQLARRFSAAYTPLLNSIDEAVK